MSMGQTDIEARLYAAFERLRRLDGDLLRIDANERSLTHKLAEYLQDEFPDWHVDCEYNRDGSDPKRLLYPQTQSNATNPDPQEVPEDDLDAKTVYPDIIVHRRGQNGSNLLVIEAKKSSTASGSEDDVKLRHYVNEFRYDHAYAVIFPVGDHKVTVPFRRVDVTP